MTRVNVLYFASLRDADLRALYDELQARHQLPFPARQLRVAVNGEFADWSAPLREGSDIAFIPPVSGG